MKQRNMETNYTRSIRRVKAPTGAPIGGWEFWDGSGVPGDRSRPIYTLRVDGIQPLSTASHSLSGEQRGALGPHQRVRAGGAGRGRPV